MENDKHWLYGKLANNDVRAVINELGSIQDRAESDGELLAQFKEFLEWKNKTPRKNKT